MPEQEPRRRGKRRGEPTPPLSVSEEVLSQTRNLLQEMNRVLNVAVDEDGIKEKYWQENPVRYDWQRREVVIAERDSY